MTRGAQCGIDKRMNDLPQAPTQHKMMANAIRALSMDAVEKAQSGHPGMPMGFADVATVLAKNFLKVDPAHPRWPDRDRLVLSAGHGSMLLYSLAYLLGYTKMTLDEIQHFRQYGRHTAGHPEYDPDILIETTTGPLGQGIANAVGMALAERMFAAEFGNDLVNHHTYCIVGDGCLMEGISQEAISFAGHHKLHKLIVLFDDNKISIDGATSLATSDDTLKRFEASGWDTQIIDGHNPALIEQAIRHARQTNTPSLIACETTIGYGSPKKAGTASAHGSPLGADEIKAARAQLGWSYEPFVIPDTVLNDWRKVGREWGDKYATWRHRYDNLDSVTKAAYDRRINGDLPEGWPNALQELKRMLIQDKASMATRQASGKVVDVLCAAIPELIGGSADLTGSNNTRPKTFNVIKTPDFKGNYIHYGVREHAMGAMMNGMRVHGGYVPFSGTFLVFSDYMKPAVRLSALMEQQVIYVFTHDSIGLGEDGPTHQPIEQLASLRSIPNLLVFRPADAVETAECWALALKHTKGPSALALTRQNVPALRVTNQDENLCARGAYRVTEGKGNPQVTLFASGSEVGLALDVYNALLQEMISASVISVPCWELFAQQKPSYIASVLSGSGLKVAIEAASPFGWERFVGHDGLICGIDRFGLSAPYQDAYKHLGLTTESIVEKIKARLAV